jgi:hypothetical protein
MPVLRVAGLENKYDFELESNNAGRESKLYWEDNFKRVNEEV